MTFGTKCREAIAKERERLGGKITAEQWDAVVDNLVVTEAVFRKKKPSSKRPKEGRPRNPLFDALALGTGTRDLSKLTRMMGKTIGVALADILEVSPQVTPDEIERVIAAYRSKHPTWPCTAMAIVKHWGEFAKSDATHAAKTDVYQEPLNWKTCEAARTRLNMSPETWALVVARGWFDLTTDLRADILRALYK